MAYIALGRTGKRTRVDDDMLDELSRHRWQLVAKKYASRNNPMVKGVRKGSTYLHRQILNAPPHLHIDHINGDTLDNRRANLRLCTRAQNLSNRSAQKNNTSGHKGVYFSASRRRWIAEIQTNGKSHYLGQHTSLEKAGRAYRLAAKDLHGEFARLS